MGYSTPRDVYQEVLKAHQAAPSFQPLIPVAILPHVALVLLGAAFLLIFFYTTLPARSTLLSSKEIGVALLASACAGLGTVALFNAVGVHV